MPSLGPEPARVVEIPGMHNVRDMGGYPAVGGTTRWGVLFRGGTLDTLSAVSRRRLAELGVRTVIDLREPAEHQATPPHANTSALSLVSNPIFRGWRFHRATSDLGFLYAQIIRQCAAEFVSAVELIARPGALPAVVHCTAGKDRTGLLVALLLSALGVPDEVVASDYALTQQALTEDLRAQLAVKARRLGMDAQQIAVAMGSPPEALITLLTRVRHEYGGAEEYLLANGLHSASLDALRCGLIEAGELP